MTVPAPSDQQIIDALARVCDRQRDASPLAVWDALHDAGHADVQHLRPLNARLHALARAGRVARHRHQGERWAYFRVAGSRLPVCCRPFR